MNFKGTLLSLKLIVLVSFYKRKSNNKNKRMIKYKVTDAAKILAVEKNTIKTWVYHFTECFSKYANSKKGEERKFTTEDICTLSYILVHWEGEPDLENIRFGLNAGDQFNAPYNSFIDENKSIFHEFDEDAVNTKSWIIGGMADDWDRIKLADSYKKAGDLLIEQGISDDENYDIAYPTLYTYRHAIELYLKGIIELNSEEYKFKKSHSLEELYEKEFKKSLKKILDVEPPKWFENMIKILHEFEVKENVEGTNFRYGISLNKDEFLVDLAHIKERMTWFQKSIHKISNLMK